MEPENDSVKVSFLGAWKYTSWLVAGAVATTLAGLSVTWALRDLAGKVDILVREAWDWRDAREWGARLKAQNPKLDHMLPDARDIQKENHSSR